MYFALMAFDNAGALDVRKATRPAHLEHLKDPIVKMAGPLLDEDGNPCGSLIILEADTRDQADAWAAADPYAHAGLFREVVIKPWNKVIG